MIFSNANKKEVTFFLIQGQGSPFDLPVHFTPVSNKGMTFAWGEETSLSRSCQGVESHCQSAVAEDKRLSRRQQQEQYRRNEKKERKQKNISITSLPTMPTSSLRSILKPSTSDDNLVCSNYLDKRVRIEDINGTVPPGVRAYWMRERQLRKSLKRGKKVQFHENSEHVKRRVASYGPNSRHNENEVFYDYDEDDDSDERLIPMVLKSDEESYCKKRASTPVPTRRSKTGIAKNGAEKIKRDDHYVSAQSTVPNMGSTQDLCDGSSSSNYSYCPNEIVSHLDCPKMVSSPLDAERCMFVRSCVKVAGDPNEDIIAFNAIRRQSINRMNAFMRSSGRYSQRGYHAYSSAMNRRINASTRRSVRGNPNFGDGLDSIGRPSNHIHVPLAAVYANDFARSSLRLSSRGVPSSWPALDREIPYQDSFSRAYGGFERSYVRGSRRSKHTGSASKQDGAMMRGSTRRQSHRRRPGLENVVFADARESTRRTRQRREDRDANGRHRQPAKEGVGDQPEKMPEPQPQPAVTHLSANQPDWPSSSSSSPYFVRPVAQVKKTTQEETKVTQEQPLPPASPTAPETQDSKNDFIHQEDTLEIIDGIPTNQHEVNLSTVPGGGGVPTVGGEINMQRHVMLPLAEEVAAGALRRSARQKKRGIAYFTFRRGKEEVVSDLEVITEDQPGRHSPACRVSTDGHWSAPESSTVATRPAVPPKPPPRPGKVLTRQNTMTPLPVLTETMPHKEPAKMNQAPILLAGAPKKSSNVVDNEPISMVHAAQELEKQLAHIARRCPPAIPPPDSASVPGPRVDSSKETESDVKPDKSKKPLKKKKKEEEKKTKKKEGKEKKEKEKKKKEKKKKKKKKDKVKERRTSESGDVASGDKTKSTPEGARRTANANAKPAPKKIPLKPPRKSVAAVANENRQTGRDAERNTDEQGHLTVIQVVNSAAGTDEDYAASEGSRLKRESGFTRLSRKISHRVGTWGKDFKRLLSFRREKPRDDTSSVGEDENTDCNEVTDQPEEVAQPVPNAVVDNKKMNVSGAYLPAQAHPKTPLLPPKCTPVSVPLPPPYISANKADENCLNFCDEVKTNQIIYWLQNVCNNQNVDEHLAMITATTLATQF